VRTWVIGCLAFIGCNDGFTVQVRNNAPECHIDAPAPDTRLEQGESFIATASCSDDGSIESVDWTHATGAVSTEHCPVQPVDKMTGESSCELVVSAEAETVELGFAVTDDIGDSSEVARASFVPLEDQPPVITLDHSGGGRGQRRTAHG
jgi:hypothetical protein